jgi:hypothetical protein
VMQERSSANNASLASRNETQTLLQLQRALGSQHPSGVSPRALVSAGFVPRNPTSRIYTVKKSGTRAEGMVLSKKTSKSAKSDRASHSHKAFDSKSVLPAVSSSRRASTQLNIPRPAQAAVRGASVLVSAQSSSLLQPSKAKLLTSGVAIFLGKAISSPSSNSGGGKSVSAPATGFSPLFSPRAMLLSPKAQTYILQLSIPAKLKVFFRALAPSRSPWERALSNIARLFMGIFRSRTGGSGLSRVDREFLNRLFRRGMRKKQRDKLIRKRVRRVSSNIARAVGKAKTADLKQYY